VQELPPRALATLDVDAVVLQRPQELGLAATWLGRKPGIDVPAAYVEHTAPRGLPDEMRHPLADHPELTLVHATHFNQLFWNAGSTPTRVIEPGIADPGYRYCGEIASAAALLEDGAPDHVREEGADLLERFGQIAPVDLLAPGRHDEIAQRRLYLHLSRSSSLGRPLLEAMHLGMPIVALATTEILGAVPPSAGIVSNRIETLEAGIRQLLDDPGRARRMGRAARRSARQRYGLERFLQEWGALLEEIVR